MKNNRTISFYDYSVIPMNVVDDDNNTIELIGCPNISGGANYKEGMPETLKLERIVIDDKTLIGNYILDGVSEEPYNETKISIEQKKEFMTFDKAIEILQMSNLVKNVDFDIEEAKSSGRSDIDNIHLLLQSIKIADSIGFIQALAKPNNVFLRDMIDFVYSYNNNEDESE